MRKIIVSGLWILLFAVLSAYAGHSSKSLIKLELGKGRVIEAGANVKTVFLADPTIADYHIKAPGVIYLYAKKIGVTSLYAVDKHGKVVFRHTVQVIHNLAELSTILREVIPDAVITVASAGDDIVLRGNVHNPAEAEDARHVAEKYAGDKAKVLNFLHIAAPTQINLKVQVIEMSRDVSRALGLNWTGGFGTTGSAFSVNPLLMPDTFAGTTPNAVSFIAALTRRHWNFAATVNMLEANGLITILSEPNLTAMSGETASFLVGGEFPIPIPQGNTGAITVMFKKFGVSLAFTPNILNDGKINLQVRPEVSQLSTEGAITIQGFQVPSLSTRRAQTTVELRSGQSFAIAGLLQSNVNKLIQQLPGLGDLPVLGALFRSEKFRRNETELVIIVTPYVVDPVQNGELMTPSNGIQLSDETREKNDPRKGNIGYLFD